MYALLAKFYPGGNSGYQVLLISDEYLANEISVAPRIMLFLELECCTL